MVLGSDAENRGSPLSTATSWNDAVISQGFLLGQLLKKSWESGYPSVPASNWKIDVLEFLRMSIVCCSCSRYFFEGAHSGSVCTSAHRKKCGPKHFTNITMQTITVYKKQRTKSLRAFFFTFRIGWIWQHAESVPDFGRPENKQMNLGGSS